MQMSLFSQANVWLFICWMFCVNLDFIWSAAPIFLLRWVTKKQQNKTKVIKFQPKDVVSVLFSIFPRSFLPWNYFNDTVFQLTSPSLNKNLSEVLYNFFYVYMSNFFSRVPYMSWSIFWGLSFEFDKAKKKCNPCTIFVQVIYCIGCDAFWTGINCEMYEWCNINICIWKNTKKKLNDSGTIDQRGTKDGGTGWQ